MDLALWTPIKDKQCNSISSRAPSLSPCQITQLHFFKTHSKTCRTKVFKIEQTKALKLQEKTLQHTHNSGSSKRAKLLWLQLRATISGSNRFFLQSVFPPPSHIMHPTDCNLLPGTRTPALQPRRPGLPELQLLPPVIPLTHLHPNPTTCYMSSADDARTSCVFPASIQVLELHLGVPPQVASSVPPSRS